MEISPEIYNLKSMFPDHSEQLISRIFHEERDNIEWAINRLLNIPPDIKRATNIGKFFWVDQSQYQERDFRHFLTEISEFDLLGSGAIGIVYLYISRKDGKAYAVKQMSDDENLDQEINNLSSLSHPTLVSLCGYLRQSSQFFLFMDYIAKKSVCSYILDLSIGRQHKEWNLINKMIIILGISFGMQYLHSKNIIHRDLKLDNILLDENFYPKICDYGLAKLPSISAALNLFAGNKIFTAPEVTTMNYGKEVDVFSFGMTLYAILSDRIPFYGEEHKISQIINGARPSLDEVNISQSMQNLIQNCWDGDPERRPSFEAITQELIKETNAMIESGKIKMRGIMKIKNYLKRIGEDPNLITQIGLFKQDIDVLKSMFPNHSEQLISQIFKEVKGNRQLIVERLRQIPPDIGPFPINPDPEPFPIKPDPEPAPIDPEPAPIDPDLEPAPIDPDPEPFPIDPNPGPNSLIIRPVKCKECNTLFLNKEELQKHLQLGHEWKK